MAKSIGLGVPTEERRKERAIISMVFGLILLLLGIGMLFGGSGFSSAPLNPGPADYIAPGLLIGAGVLLLSIGIFLRRR